jgi:hypothetical protein
VLDVIQWCVLGNAQHLVMCALLRRQALQPGCGKQNHNQQSDSSIASHSTVAILSNNSKQMIVSLKNVRQEIVEGNALCLEVPCTKSVPVKKRG